MIIAIRKNEVYINYAERFTDGEITQAPYNYTLHEVGDIPFDCVYADFDKINDFYVFNKDKYEKRKGINKQTLYKEKIIELIRLKYDADDELALLHQKEENADEYAAYLVYRQECKDKAKAEIFG